MQNCIRRRLCEYEYVKNTSTYFLTGQRISSNNPPINLSLGDVVPIYIIESPGVRRDDIEIQPIFIDNENTTKVKIEEMYEKKFNDITDFDMLNMSPLIKDKYTLQLYLALLYNLTMDDIQKGYVTIVKTSFINQST